MKASRRQKPEAAKKETDDVSTEPKPTTGSAADAATDSKVESKVERKTSFDSARQYVMIVLGQAQVAVDDLRRRVVENDRVARASERTMVFLDSAKAQVEQAVKMMRDTPLADLRSKAVSESLALANKAVHTFNTSASQIPSQVAAGVAAARAEALKRINAAVVAVDSWRVAAMSYSVRKLSEFDAEHSLSARACDWASVAVERTKSIDLKFQMTENAKKLYQNAVDIDQKWKVSESALNVAKRAQTIGDSLTGSRVSPVVSYVSELAVSGYTSSVASLIAAKNAVKEQAAQQRKDGQVVANKTN